MRPVPNFIAAKLIVDSAASGLGIQTKRGVISQIEVDRAASGLEAVAATRVQ